MTIGELIEVRRFPAVVQAADVRDLRISSHRVLSSSSNSDNTSHDALHDFISGYLGFDERARHAVDVCVRSLAGGQGGSFFFNGVFGSGKSHLLGLFTLLCDGLGHETFAATHNHLAPALQNFASRLTVYFSLDEYSAQEFSLEEIFWRELRGECSDAALHLMNYRFPQALRAAKPLRRWKICWPQENSVAWPFSLMNSRFSFRT
jgi:hypothetical protein